MAAPKGRFFPVQTMHLGPVGTFAGFNEAALPIGGSLGQVIEDSGKCYRLVKFNSGTAAVASAAGSVVHWKDRDNFEVVSDQTDAQAGTNGVAGGALGVLTTGSYGFIQIGGKQTVNVVAATAAGDSMVGGAVDGQLARMPGAANYLGIPVAVAYTPISSGTATVHWLLGNLL